MGKIISLKHSIDAKHIKNIGEQSVSSAVQAVLEMVKNSYDADADICTVHFYAKTSLTKYLDVYKIVVEDDGVGMTFNDLDKKWMRIGTESKELHKESPCYLRRVSGEKGMGHFATQKLGNKICLVSDPLMYSKRPREKYDEKTLSLKINWQNYKPGLDFDDIPNDLEILNRENPDKHGISIELTDLNDVWTMNDIEQVQINLGSILLPKFIRKTLKNPFDINVVAHGFTLAREEIDSTIEQYAPWEIDCRLKGTMAYYEISKLNTKLGKRMEARHINNTAPGKGKFAVGKGEILGDVKFKMLYYRGKSIEWLPAIVKKKKDIENQLKENCGIKIFNDGIRVMPYGEPENDWLGLSERKVKRAGGKLRNELAMGFILVTREENKEIIETTTRQALVENQAYDVLRDDFVLETIEIFEAYLKEAIDAKAWNEVREVPGTKASSELKQIDRIIDKSDISKSEKNTLGKKFKEVQRLIDKQESDFVEKEDEITHTLQMYRNLSSLGISALAFHHEITEPMSRIMGYNDELIRRWDKMSDKIKIENITSSKKDTWIINDLNSYIREFAALFKGAKGSHRDKEEIDINATLTRLEKGFAGLLENRKVSIEHIAGPGSFKNLYMNAASFESILLNLITNSIRALFQVKRIKKIILIDYKKHLGYLEIRITDNGCGIEEGNREKIFRPFWTTFKGEAQKGTGMGMTIVRETISDEYAGTVHVEKSTPESISPGRGKTTIFVRIPLDALENPNS